MGGVRILLSGKAEDRAVVRRALEASELRATIAEVDAVAALASEAMASGFDCVIASAIADVAALRASGVTAPILASRGNPDEAFLQAAIDAGATDLLDTQELAPRRLAMRVRLVLRATRNAQIRDEVLAIVSHDLRGPLHAIGLACEALRELGTDETARYVGTIERASHRAERLIADLLEMSAVENGALAIDPRPTDLVALARQAILDHELAVTASGGTLSLELDRSISTASMTVRADRDRVLQVLANLIGNAIKHAKGTPITLHLAPGEGEALISVRDGGPGIPESDLPRVFDRYWRGRTKRGGAGLGLAIAKGIVDAHGGAITVTSTRDHGASFMFSLPLVR